MSVRPHPSSFFDWASTSPLRPEASAAQQTYLDGCAASVDAPAWHRAQMATLEDLRGAVRRLVGAPVSYEVVLGRSISEMMAVLSRGLRVPGRPTVLLADCNHPAAVICWLQQRDLEPAVVRTTDGKIDLEHLSSLLTDNVLAVVLSHVTHTDGRVQPIDEVVRLAAEVGAVVIVDAAQSVGRMPMTLSSWDGVLLMGTGRKALLAPMGTGFLVGSPRLLNLVEPLIASTRSTEPWSSASVEARAVHRECPDRLEGNLPDLGALAGLHAAVDRGAEEAEQVLEHARRLTAVLERVLDEAGVPVALEHGGVGIVRVGLPVDVLGGAVQQRLRSDGLVIAASMEDLRVSFHRANQEADVSRLGRAIAAVVGGR